LADFGILRLWRWTILAALMILTARPPQCLQMLTSDIV